VSVQIEAPGTWIRCASKVRSCVTCSLPLVYDMSVVGGNGWGHADGSKGHWVDPAPMCPRCGGGSYTTDCTGAWGNSSECADCGHHEYMSLGD
jgi:hypothetical protein